MNTGSSVADNATRISITITNSRSVKPFREPWYRLLCTFRATLLIASVFIGRVSFIFPGPSTNLRRPVGWRISGFKNPVASATNKIGQAFSLRIGSATTDGMTILNGRILRVSQPQQHELRPDPSSQPRESLTTRYERERSHQSSAQRTRNGNQTSFRRGLRKRRAALAGG